MESETWFLDAPKIEQGEDSVSPQNKGTWNFVEKLKTRSPSGFNWHETLA